MKYGQSLILTRNSTTGSLDDDTGIFTPSGESETIYEGKVDAQDVDPGLSYKGSDLQTKQADLEVFLKEESKIFDIKIGDTGVLTRAGFSQNVSVLKLRVLDGVIECIISGA